MKMEGDHQNCLKCLNLQNEKDALLKDMLFHRIHANEEHSKAVEELEKVLRIKENVLSNYEKEIEEYKINQKYLQEEVTRLSECVKSLSSDCLKFRKFIDFQTKNQRESEDLYNALQENMLFIENENKRLRDLCRQTNASIKLDCKYETSVKFDKLIKYESNDEMPSKEAITLDEELFGVGGGDCEMGDSLLKVELTSPSLFGVSPPSPQQECNEATSSPPSSPSPCISHRKRRAPTSATITSKHDNSSASSTTNKRVASSIELKMSAPEGPFLDGKPLYISPPPQRVSIKEEVMSTQQDIGVESCKPYEGASNTITEKRFTSTSKSTTASLNDENMDALWEHMEVSTCASTPEFGGCVEGSQRCVQELIGKRIGGVNKRDVGYDELECVSDTLELKPYRCNCQTLYTRILVCLNNWIQTYDVLEMIRITEPLVQCMQQLFQCATPSSLMDMNTSKDGGFNAFINTHTDWISGVVQVLICICGNLLCTTNEGGGNRERRCVDVIKEKESSRGSVLSKMICMIDMLLFCLFHTLINIFNDGKISNKYNSFINKKCKGEAKIYYSNFCEMLRIHGDKFLEIQAFNVLICCSLPNDGSAIDCKATHWKDAMDTRSSDVHITVDGDIASWTVQICKCIALNAKGEDVFDVLYRKIRDECTLKRRKWIECIALHLYLKLTTNRRDFADLSISLYLTKMSVEEMQSSSFTDASSRYLWTSALKLLYQNITNEYTKLPIDGVPHYTQWSPPSYPLILQCIPFQSILHNVLLATGGVGLFVAFDVFCKGFGVGWLLKQLTVDLLESCIQLLVDEEDGKKVKRLLLCALDGMCEEIRMMRELDRASYIEMVSSLESVCVVKMFSLIMLSDCYLKEVYDREEKEWVYYNKQLIQCFVEVVEEWRGMAAA